MRLLATLGFALVLSAISGAASAAEVGKLPVSVKATGSDDTGRAMSFYLKDRIQASGSFMFVPPTQASVQIVIQSLGVDGSTTGLAAYSMVLIFHSADPNEADLYINSNVGYCSSEVAEKCAADIMSRIGPTLLDWRDAFDAIKDQPKTAPKPQRPSAPSAPVPSGPSRPI